MRLSERDAPLLLLFGWRRLVIALADHGEHKGGHYEQHADQDQVRHTLPHVVLLVASITSSHSTRSNRSSMARSSGNIRVAQKKADRLRVQERWLRTRPARKGVGELNGNTFLLMVI